MKKIIALLGLFSTAVFAEQLTIERIFSDPNLAGTPPGHFAFSPDSSRITYLKGREEDYNRYDLWQFDLNSKQHSLLVDSAKLFPANESLSDEEKARRERQRIFGRGIMEYKWSPKGDSLLFPLGGELYLYQLAKQELKQLTNSEAFETDSRFSPQGNYVSFVREQNLYAIELKSGKQIQLTFDGKNHIKNGMAEFVAQEEMDRMTGYWWAPDDSKIAFTRVDESPVDLVTRNEIYADGIKLIDQRYPATGRNNVAIRLGVIGIDKRHIHWIDTGKEKDIYLARVNWTNNANQLTWQWQSRDQKLLRLNRVDLKSNKQQVLLEEQQKSWVNLHRDIHFLEKKNQFIWASERDGYKHLYLHNNDGSIAKQLTQGKWVVDEVVGVDEQNGWLYFTGRKDTPLEKQGYRVALTFPYQIETITQSGAFHNLILATDKQHLIDSYSSNHSPSQVRLISAQGEPKEWLYENSLAKQHPLSRYISDWSATDYGTLQADDGQALYYGLTKPKQMEKGKKYPVIVLVYGGPGAQTVQNRWVSQTLFKQYLVQQGYVVFQLDNRGSYYRGKAFENPIYQHLGKVELQDQIAGVKHLRTLPFVDPLRIGIYGHSYGGYMSIMAMFNADNYFSAGVSGAPVTDWRLYDTHYTERYLGHPQTNKKGYELSSVFPYSDKLEKPLMIYHGMADDNVLFSNSTRLFKQLQDQGKLYESLVYPGKKHSIRGKQARIHMYKSIVDFFDRRLK